MKNGTKRWQLKFSDDHPNPFIKIPTQQFMGVTNGYKLNMRVVEGHSFLSGFDVPLFDGSLQLEVKAEDQHKPEGSGVLIGAFLVTLKQALPRQIVEWKPEESKVEISLFESCEVPVNESSKRIMVDIAHAFALQPEDLLEQLPWELVEC